MKILVCISHVPDTTTKIVFQPDGKSLNTQGVTFIINPYDEFGLVRAIELQEQGIVTQITAICVGGAEVEPTLRKALAIGATDAVRVDAQPNDSGFVAQQIAAFAKGKDYGVIFMGKESIDYNGGMVPGMVAERLGMPFVSFATKFDISGNTATLHREIDGGEEIIEAQTPLVVSCQKGMAEWRIPNMRGIMSARTKPLSVVEATGQSTAQTLGYTYPPAKGSCQYFSTDEVENLATALIAKGAL